MEIKQCFEVLDLNHDASISDAKQAYRDLVNVWHPDRFSHNPRLRKKAEEKLKQANEAYECLKLFLLSKQDMGMHENHQHCRQTSNTTFSYQSSRPLEISRTEAAVEAGTRIVLTICSHAFKKLHHFMLAQASDLEENVKKKSRTDNKDNN